MTRKGLLIACVLSGVFTGVADAADVSASELKSRWARAVAPSSPVSVKFRWRQRDLVFETEKFAEGVFYHDGQDRWAIRLNTIFGDSAVSALQPSNRLRQKSELLEPYVVICTEGSHLIGSGDLSRCESGPWHPVSACDPENIAPSFSFSDIFRNLSRLVRSQLEIQRQMPLLLPKSGDFSTHRTVAKQHSNGDLWLTFTPDEHSWSAAACRQIDVVFRSNFRSDENLPYAIRVISASGNDVTRFLFDEVRIGVDAVIPADAFDVPAMISRETR